MNVHGHAQKLQMTSLICIYAFKEKKRGTWVVEHNIAGFAEFIKTQTNTWAC